MYSYFPCKQYCTTTLEKKYYHQEKVEILVWNFLKPKIEWHRLEAEKFENQIMVVNVPINKKTERTVPSC